MTFDEWWGTQPKQLVPAGFKDDARAIWGASVAAERERWQRIAEAAQAVTTGCNDKLDYFELPSHLMAALALALDDGPNVADKRREACA